MKNNTLLLNFQNCSFVSPRKFIWNSTCEIPHTLGKQRYWRACGGEVTFRVHVSSLRRFPFHASLSFASLLLLIHSSPILNNGRGRGDFIKFHSKSVNNATPPMRLSQDEAWAKAGDSATLSETEAQSMEMRHLLQTRAPPTAAPSARPNPTLQGKECAFHF